MHVRLGHVPNPFSLPVAVALERGHFAEQGIQLEVVTFQNGTLASAALAEGGVDVAVGGHIQTLAALLSGSDQVFIGSLGFERSPNHLPIALVAAGGISHGRELEGEVVGVSARAAISELQLRIFMHAAGADFGRVTLAPMPFDEMAQALRDSRIVAASCPDPFAGRLVSGGLARIVDRGSLSRALPDGERAMITGLAATRAWAERNPAPARALVAAVGSAIDELRARPAPPGEHVPHYDRRLGRGDLQRVYDLAAEHGLVERAVDAGELIAAPG
jgi:NitT/TauT family transport system substrate-binding protein